MSSCEVTTDILILLLLQFHAELLETLLRASANFGFGRSVSFPRPPPPLLPFNVALPDNIDTGRGENLRELVGFLWDYARVGFGQGCLNNSAGNCSFIVKIFPWPKTSYRKP